MSRSVPILRPFYYLDHFEEMISFLERNCGNLLGEKESQLIEDFRGLSTGEQAWLVRLANRSRCVFRIDELQYDELPPLRSVLPVLLESSFIRPSTPEDCNGILEILKRTEIVGLLKPLRGLSSKKKPELLEMLLRHEALGNHIEGLASGYLVFQRSKTFEFLFFLYFGKLRRNLQALALRDLGIIKTRPGQKSFETRFSSHGAATIFFFYASLSEEISQANETGLAGLAAGISGWPIPPEADAAICRDREICRLGMRLEQSNLPCLALSVYGHTTGHPARERMCRILFARKEIDRTKELLAEMLSRPSTDEELLFADDFHSRKFGGRNLSTVTQLLRCAPEIRIDEAYRDSPEDAAVDHFQKKGERAYRTENHLWTSLFGLLFWEPLQGEDGETKHNEFEHRPTQLADGSFFRRSEASIRKQLSLLHSGDALPYLERIVSCHEGKANGVFRWRRNTLAVIQELLVHAPADAVEAILMRMATDPTNNWSGFPDLMVVSERRLRFVEIKAEGDQIRRHQLVQLQALEKAGFAVGVVRVGWFADPDQEYVVVDVETTGGRADTHRVTEIGAVKIHKGRIIGKFSTLINPETNIPQNIIRLTGISNAMVANSPRFLEIAEEFRLFVGEAVFVAHNAAFDFGFIREEYRRMGQRFRCATICTVAAMRRFFPGLPSYGLAALTHHFGIPLHSHHRALCDAEATAQLLILINEKRAGGLPSKGGLAGQPSAAATRGQWQGPGEISSEPSEISG